MCLAVPAEIVELGDYVLVHAGFAIHKWERSEVEEFEAIRAGLDPEELPT